MEAAVSAGPSTVASALSIRAAAAERPDDIGLIHDGHEYTFAELAERTRCVMAALGEHAQRVGAPDATGLPMAVVAEPALGTTLAIYAGFELGVTCALVHDRSPAAERAAWLALCRELPPGRPGRARMIVFTSGSTGASKGVVLGSDAFLASAAGNAANLGWHAEDRWLCCLPLAHVGGLSIVVRCLAARKPVVLDHEPHFDAQRIAARIADQRITLVSLVPTMLMRLLQAGWSPPAHLRAVLLGGAAAQAELLAAASERGVPVLATYGMTETCSQVCTQEYGRRPAAHGQSDGHIDGRIGPPIPGAEVRIVQGRIQVRGPMLLDGYLGAPSPLDADGWFQTGDHGRIDAQGALYVLGRADDIIITGGENVHPAEVEAVLAMHPAVAQACVFGIEDATWGQLLAAAVVCREGAVLTPVDLAGFLAPRLPAHKRPRRLALVSSLALNRTGKIDRRGVAREAAARLEMVDYQSRDTRHNRIP